MLSSLKALSSRHRNSLTPAQIEECREELLPHLTTSLSARAKRLALRVDPKSNKIKLIVPRFAKDIEVLTFIYQNRNWIAARLQDMPDNVPFADGETLPIFGTPRLIKVVPHDKRATRFTLEDDALTIHTRRDDPASNIRRYLIDLARDTITPLAHEKAAEIGKEISAITLRDPSSRWGSCSHDGRISFSWRLVFCPPDVLDYIVGHEVAHLQHMDHSDRFWNLCDQISNDMTFGKQWLKSNGSALMRYGMKA